MKGWFPWSLKPPHEGETCDEVEDQLHATYAEINEARAMLARLMREHYDPELTIADNLRIGAGMEPRGGEPA